MPYPHKSFSAKEPYISWFFGEKWPATLGILWVFATFYSHKPARCIFTIRNRHRYGFFLRIFPRLGGHWTTPFAIISWKFSQVSSLPNWPYEMAMKRNVENFPGLGKVGRLFVRHFRRNSQKPAYSEITVWNVYRTWLLRMCPKLGRLSRLLLR